LFLLVRNVYSTVTPKKISRDGLQINTGRVFRYLSSEITGVSSRQDITKAVVLEY